MKYYVNSTVEHDRRVFKRGDTIELTKEQAEELLEIGVIGSEKPTEDVTPQVSEAEEEANDVTVGGDANQSGEQSLDQGGAEATRAEAEDVTPQVSEKMTREELEDIAKAEGISEVQVDVAKTKADLVKVIEANREGSSAADEAADNL